MILSEVFLEFVPIFHRFNKFLGSDGGSLLTGGFEFLLFLFIAYIATSQYLKSKNRQIKYLSVSFLTLALTKGIGAAFYSATVFGDVSRVWVDVIIPPFEICFEVIAIYLLGVALSYQLLRVKIKHLREKFIAVSTTTTILLLGFLTYWLATVTSRPYELFIRTDIFTILELIKLIVLGCFIGFMVKYYEKALKVEKYANIIVQALVVYAVPSLLHIINFLFYNNINESLHVLANPFPFIAVFIFIRYIYLKMADKASILDKLDLTEKKYEKIKQITKIKDEFVSVAGHELKTPLTTINLYTSLLADGTFGEVSDKQKEALFTLKAETNRLTNLVNDLLDLSRIQNRKLVLNKKQVLFHGLVKDVLFGFQAQNPEMTLQNNVPEDVHVHTDNQRIQQVLINLISNAIKFTPKDGSIKIGAKKTKKSFVFSVQDNGKGIPKEKLSYLFQKFYQVDPHLAREQGIMGLGLGLSIVKGIIDAHEGEIHVESELDKGTTFTVRIPQEPQLLRPI